MDDLTPEARDYDPEPATHAMHTLTITGLDYIRLRSWLLRDIEAWEASARANPEFADIGAAHAKECQRILSGLAIGWKPGRAPDDVSRWERQKEALEAARK